MDGDGGEKISGFGKSPLQDQRENEKSRDPGDKKMDRAEHCGSHYGGDDAAAILEKGKQRPPEAYFFRDGDEGGETTEPTEGYLEPPEINDDGTELTFRLVSGQWGPGDHTIHLRLEMVDAEGSPVSVDAGTFEFSGV